MIILHSRSQPQLLQNSDHTLADDGTTFAISDMAAATNIQGVSLGSITIQNSGSTGAVIFAIIGNYAGKPVAEIIEALGGLSAAVPVGVVSVDFNDHTTIQVSWVEGVLTDDVLTEDVLTISNLLNPIDVRDNNGQVIPGELKIGTVSFAVTNFPTGYYVSDFKFVDSLGDGATNFIVSSFIAEGVKTAKTVVADNQVFYDTEIMMDSSVVDISANDIVIQITDTLNVTIVIDSGDISKNTNTTPVSFVVDTAELYNFNNDALVLVDGNVFVGDSTTSDIAVELNDSMTNFPDPAGTDHVDIILEGVFNARRQLAVTEYNLVLNIARSDSVLFTDSAGNTDEFHQGEAEFYNIAPCATPVISTFYIDENSDTIVIDDSLTSPNYYYDSGRAVDGSNSYDLARLSPEGDVIDIITTLNIVECTEFQYGNGDSTDPYQISSDLHLDLLSRLVAKPGDDGYRKAHYLVTADLDMGITMAPWAESSTHSGANSAGFTPIGFSNDDVMEGSDTLSEYYWGYLSLYNRQVRRLKRYRTNIVSSLWWPAVSGSTNQVFEGHFDCEDHFISNLYINTGKSYIGLFGLVKSATIQNCKFDTAKVKGESSVGTVVGYAYDSTISNILVSNSAVKGKASLGGVVGNAFHTDIGHGVVVASSIKISNTPLGVRTFGAGGIVGLYAGTGTISNVYVAATLWAKDDADIGGIAGGVMDLHCNTKISDSGFNSYPTCQTDYTAEGQAGVGFMCKSGVSAEDQKPLIQDAYFRGTLKTSYVGGLSPYITELKRNHFFPFTESNTIIAENDEFFGFDFHASGEPTQIAGIIAGSSVEVKLKNVYSVVEYLVDNPTYINRPTLGGVGTGIIFSGNLDVSANFNDDNSYEVNNALRLYGVGSSLLTEEASYWGSESADLPDGDKTDLGVLKEGSGIYVNWDANIWDFGGSVEYPALKGLYLNEVEQRSAATDISL